eukprot:365983-Chlamydomonas_euryale.AAC.21
MGDGGPAVCELFPCATDTSAAGHAALKCWHELAHAAAGSMRWLPRLPTQTRSTTETHLVTQTHLGGNGSQDQNYANPTPPPTSPTSSRTDSHASHARSLTPKPLTSTKHLSQT